MSSLPWEPDRELTVDTARSTISDAFPNVDVGAVEHLGSGWEFDAYLTADRWVFRFPRRAEYQALFEQERPALTLARSALPSETAVPLIELVGEPTHAFPYVFAGHRLIDGVAADSVSGHLYPEMARSIGIALGALHSVPVPTARAAGVRAAGQSGEGGQEWFRRNLDGASRLVGSNVIVDRAVAWASSLVDPLRTVDAPLRFTHHDLSPEHLVVNPATGRLAGILDWTDAILGDAATDLVTVVAFGGWDFFEQVLANYPHPVDRGFRERLRFKAQFLAVMWLGEAQQNGGDVVKHVAWVGNAFAEGGAS